MPIYNPAAAAGGGGGKFTGNVSAITSTYVATADDDVLLCTGTFTVTLYAASGNSGESLIVKNCGGGTITITGDGVETIDDGLVSVLAGVKYEAKSLVCSGSAWWVY